MAAKALSATGESADVTFDRCDSQLKSCNSQSADDTAETEFDLASSNLANCLSTVTPIDGLYVLIDVSTGRKIAQQAYPETVSEDTITDYFDKLATMDLETNPTSIPVLHGPMSGHSD